MENCTAKDYQELLEQSERDLPKIRLRGLQLIQLMDNAEDGAHYGLDWYWFGIVDKSSFLIDGVKNCIKEKNLTVLGILLRTQIDNCLRAFAPTLVDNPHEFSLEVLSGKPLNKIRDKDGNVLKDYYLREKLAVIDDKINAVYEASSGYVHFSKIGMLHTLKLDENNENEVNISIGIIRNEDLTLIQEGYYAFLHFTNLLYEKLLVSWIKTKREVALKKITVQQEEK